MKQEEWISRLRKGMAEHEEAIPERLWEKIEEALPVPAGQVQGNGPSKNGKARVVWLKHWRAVAVITLLAIVGGTAYHQYSGPSQHEGRQVAMNRPTKGMLPASNNEKGASTVGMAVHNAGIKHDTMRVLHGMTRETNAAKPEMTESHAAEKQPETYEENTPEGEISGSAMPESGPGTVPPPHAESASLPQTGQRGCPSLPPGTSPRHGSRLSASLFVQNVFNSAQALVEPIRLDQQFLENCKYFARMNNTPNDYYSNSHEQTKHHLPISVGVAISYQINEKWAIESGMNYIKVHSDFVQIMGRNAVMSQQSLHYMGIPLRMRYRLWNYKKLNIYGTAGSEVNVNVKARYETEAMEQPIEKDRLQWALHTAMGFQYDLLPNLGAYVEPGLKYYFENGSHLENIFKDKPLSCHLQLGIRYSIR